MMVSWQASHGGWCFWRGDVERDLEVLCSDKGMSQPQRPYGVVVSVVMLIIYRTDVMSSNPAIYVLFF